MKEDTASGLPQLTQEIPQNERARRLRETYRRIISQHQLMAVGLSVLFFFGIISLFPQVFATHDPYEIIVVEKHQPPSKDHWFGTDDLGRDIYSRVIYGMRLSLTAGILVVSGALVLGGLVGIVAGYRGGRTDDLIMRVADLFLAFPALIMAMAVVTVLGAGLRNAMLALIIVWWPQYARLARSLVLSVKEDLLVEAAIAVGAGETRIILRHILPNIFPPIFVKATLDLGQAILVTAALSFLGIGARPPEPELGAMVTGGRGYLLTSWWYSTFPGIVIFIAVLAVNFVGDGLRDLLDPRLRKI
jgi:peptide/nickel transport system permease protein